MKKIVFLLSTVCLFAISAFAQTPNFEGEWKLDTSKLDERRAATIKSQTMSVTQNTTEIKATTTTERNAPPAGGGGQGGPPGGGGGRGPGGGDGTSTYKLDGSEVTTEREFNGITITTKTTAKIEGGKLQVVTKSVGPDGTERTSKATWELSTDGKTLTVKRTQPGRDGAEVTSESVYKKG